MKKLALILAFLIGSVASAAAVCTGPAVMHDFPGTSFNMSLATVPDGNCGSNVAIPTWAGGTLGAMAAYGTSPGAVLVPGVNAFVTNTLAGITPGDAIATGTYPTGSPTIGAMLLWNGTTYDRWKSAGVTGVAAVRPTDGTRNAIIDPCEANVQTFAPILMTTATTLRIIAPSASNKNYICSLFLNASAADNIAFVEGTGGSCVTGITGIIGGTTTANGFNFVANGGVLLQAGGKVAIAQTAGTNVDTCLITSTTGPLIGGVRYVQAP